MSIILSEYIARVVHTTRAIIHSGRFLHIHVQDHFLHPELLSLLIMMLLLLPLPDLLLTLIPRIGHLRTRPTQDTVLPLPFHILVMLLVLIHIHIYPLP